MEPQLYESKEFAALRERILSGYRGKAVLVVGRSHTVLEALGGARPVPALTEEDYDFLFRVTVPAQGEVSVQVSQYGAAHHQTEAPSR